ncbi:NUDIX domain-containing protein [Streptomyces sp. bgisy153]|uniref:NUDIX domain-containing protein n=1 Tax=Streptomyces sp. bgisy153 TaxID=3413793 RepID=UPI003D73D5C9
MTPPPRREAARAVVLDADTRVLLLRYDENGGFWATPGGSLEDGEDHITAALRELSRRTRDRRDSGRTGGAARGAQQGPPGRRTRSPAGGTLLPCPCLRGRC